MMNLKRHLMRTTERPEGRAPFASLRAFTLIELMLVMAILVAILAVVAPTLGPFFRGRTAEEEARRFLALTRYGQSRAVAEGMPMTLWVDAQSGTYGLEIETGFAETDDKAKDFELDEKLTIEATLPPVTAATTTASAASQQTASVLLAGNAGSSLPTIRFTPDGFIAETSPESISINGADGLSVVVAQSRNRLNYEIQLANASR